MLAAIWLVAKEVAVVEKSEVKLTRPVPAVEQSGNRVVALRPIVLPVQNTRDSGIMPLSTICVAVLAATDPESPIAPVPLIVAWLVMRTKKRVVWCSRVFDIINLHCNVAGSAVGGPSYDYTVSSC